MNNSLKKIYFHVGLAKTGSTFLQKNFFPYLKNIKYISTHSYRNCINIINKTNYDSYLISREFDRPLEQEIKKISNVFPQTKIIIVFRKHEKWISSQFKRMSKNGWHWSFEQFYKNDNSGYWKHEDMNYIDKIRIVKKYTKNPLILNFDELKLNPYIFLDKIKNYLNADYSKNKISLNVVHKSWSEKQLIFLKKFCKIFKKHPPEYYPDDKIRHWLFYRPWWLLFHLVMYIGYFIPKSFIVKRPLIDNGYLKKCMKKYDNDWKEILKISKS